MRLEEAGGGSSKRTEVSARGRQYRVCRLGKQLRVRVFKCCVWNARRVSDGTVVAVYRGMGDGFVSGSEVFM